VSRRLPTLAAVLLTAAALYGASSWALAQRPARVAASVRRGPVLPAQPRRHPTDYEVALERARTEVGTARAFADREPRSGLRRSQEAAAHLALAQLTGDTEEYARAEEAIERAFVAGDGFGPFLLRASLNYGLHRFEAVRADLPNIRPSPWAGEDLLADRLGLQADLDFQAGRYEATLEGTLAALDVRRDFAGLCRLAHYADRTGDLARAEKAYDQAAALLGPEDDQGLAWLELQRGLMQEARGRRAVAMSHYRDADRAFSGWWLVEEHIAAAEAHGGRPELALEMYRDLVGRVGHPEHMDAVARILREKGETAEAARWIARARGVYEERLARFPEATWGHALAHFLELERDAARAVELGRANAALRPGGEARTQLAQAYLLAGRIEEARAEVEAVLGTHWRTAETHATAALTFELAGDAARAAAERARADEIDAHAATHVAWLRDAALVARTLSRR